MSPLVLHWELRVRQSKRESRWQSWVMLKERLIDVPLLRRLVAVRTALHSQRMSPYQMSNGIFQFFASFPSNYPTLTAVISKTKRSSESVMSGTCLEIFLLKARDMGFSDTALHTPQNIMSVATLWIDTNRISTILVPESRNVSIINSRRLQRDNNKNGLRNPIWRPKKESHTTETDADRDESETIEIEEGDSSNEDENVKTLLKRTKMKMKKSIKLNGNLFSVLMLRWWRRSGFPLHRWNICLWKLPRCSILVVHMYVSGHNGMVL